MANATKKLARQEPKYIQVGLADKQLARPKICFSFQFFKQINYFGIGEETSKWFDTLFKRMRELEQFTVEDFEDKKQAETYRMHNINWTNKYIPIKQEDLDWLPNSVISKEQEVQLKQFELTANQGRVIGFFVENIFYVVLLDPKHNMQPVTKVGAIHEGEVPKTVVGITELEKLRDLRHGVDIKCGKCAKCQTGEECNILKRHSYSTSGSEYGCICISKQEELYTKHDPDIAEYDFADRLESFLFQNV